MKRKLHQPWTNEKIGNIVVYGFPKPTRKPKKKLPKKKTISQLKKEADTIMSWIVRSVGACERCGKTTNLQDAHIITRSNLRLRYHLWNHLCLCAGCHLFWWHKEPLESVTWFQKTYPKQYSFLMSEKNKPIHRKYDDYIKLIKELKGYKK